MKGFLLIVFLLVSNQAVAECRYLKQSPGTSLSADDTGAASSLRNTMTLDCLQLTQIGTINGLRVAVVKDSKHRTYFVKVGDYIGENNGHIIELHEKKLVVQQTHFVDKQKIKKRVVINLVKQAP